jgi:hypothetical protein
MRPDFTPLRPRWRFVAFRKVFGDLQRVGTGYQLLLAEDIEGDARSAGVLPTSQRTPDFCALRGRELRRNVDADPRALGPGVSLINWWKSGTFFLRENLPRAQQKNDRDDHQRHGSRDYSCFL